MKKLSAFSYSKEVILKKRNYIREQLLDKSTNIKNGTLSAISTEDLRLLFELYDQVFFDENYKTNFFSSISFTLSTRMTTAAGKTIIKRHMNSTRCEKITYEIRIGTNLFFKYYALKRDKIVCGIKTKDSLEALQLVFEHELCHLIEFLEHKTSSCKKQRFKTLAFNLFGHTSSYHVLPTNKEIASETTFKHQLAFDNSPEPSLQIGDNIMFDFKGTIHKGVIHRINKRATVMVPHKKGSFLDTNGQRFMKYYVPLSLLRKD